MDSVDQKTDDTLPQNQNFNDVLTGISPAVLGSWQRVTRQLSPDGKWHNHVDGWGDDSDHGNHNDWS